MQIKWLRTALKNLNDEAVYIAKDGPQNVVIEFKTRIRFRKTI